MKLYILDSYFTTTEFSCPCGCGFGRKQEDINKDLLDKLNMMRILYGEPMVVLSGARCEEYNRSVGGVEDSAHLPHAITGQCRAVDILVRSSSARFTLINLGLKLGITRFGLATTFLHMDVAWDLPGHVMFNY